jgi:hypothetical protein
MLGPITHIAGGGREARGGTKLDTPVPPLVLLDFRQALVWRPQFSLRRSKLVPRELARVPVQIGVFAGFRAHSRSNWGWQRA